jgi:hypothetical protein
MGHGAWGMEHARSEATKSRTAGGHGARTKINYKEKRRFSAPLYGPGVNISL